jgi:hypothetical protein
MVYDTGPTGPISFPEVERQYNEALDEFKRVGIGGIRSELETLKSNLSLCLNNPEHGQKAREYHSRVEQLLNS